MADSDSTSPDKKRQQPPPIEFLKPGEEQPAQPSPERPPAAWVTRPEDYQRPQYAQAPPQPRPAPQGAGNTARIAGVVLVLAAVVSGAYFILNSLTPMSVSDYANLTNATNSSIYALSQVCAVFVLWGQAIMALAGIMAFRGLNWRMTVGAAFVGMILLGGFALAFLDPVLLGTAFVGIVGFILTVVAKKEFVS